MDHLAKIRDTGPPTLAPTMAHLRATLPTVVIAVVGTTSSSSNSHRNRKFTFMCLVSTNFCRDCGTTGFLTFLVGNIRLSIRTAATTVPMYTNHMAEVTPLPAHRAVRLPNNILKAPPFEEIIGEGLVAFEEDNNSPLAEVGEVEVDSRMPSGMPTQAVAGPSTLDLYQT